MNEGLFVLLNAWYLLCRVWHRTILMIMNFVILKNYYLMSAPFPFCPRGKGFSSPLPTHPCSLPTLGPLSIFLSVRRCGEASSNVARRSNPMEEMKDSIRPSIPFKTHAANKLRYRRPFPSRNVKSGKG